ncbi:MAG: aminodeoxychorismate synthase component I [Nocardioidaceae bacterium]
MTPLLPWVDPEDFYVAHVAGRDRAFWLDGSGARPWSGRLSVIGWLDDDELSLTGRAGGAVRQHGADAADLLDADVFAAMGRLGDRRPAPSPWRWVGFLGYAARPDLPAIVDPDPDAFDSCVMRVRRFVTFDHARHRVRAIAPDDEVYTWHDEITDLVSATSSAPRILAPPAARVVSTWDSDRYGEAFAAVQHHLRLGNSYETNLTFRTLVESAADPLSTYRRLRRINPAPYAAFIRHEGTSLLSASPERFATISAAGVIETRPIKGTTPRHPEPDRDAEAARRLTQDPKFRGENLMIVDLLRNDMARVCALGSVEVTDLMHVESYPTVHQLITTIQGRLRDGVDAIEALWALFPGGSMTGAPKLRTMEIIAEVEDTPRGPYSGAVGWVLDDGSADLGIVIRSLVHRDTHYTLGTGGGITVSSDVDEEYAEASWKTSRLLASLGIP